MQDSNMKILTTYEKQANDQGSMGIEYATLSSAGEWNHSVLAIGPRRSKQIWIHPAKKVFEHLRYFVSKNLY